MPMYILAHRAYQHGIDPTLENSFEAVQAALNLGWGVETDIRRDAAGRFYISHDPAPWTPQNDATRFLEAIGASMSPPTAINIKETGYERDLITELDKHGALDRSFLFDMELVEPERGATTRIIHKLAAHARTAVRVSDRGEPVEAALQDEHSEFVWLDEFDSLWATERDITRLRDAGKTVYAISPEIHGFAMEKAQERWTQFSDWGVSGICTDYPHLAAQAFAQGS